MNNFITNSSDGISLKKRLNTLIENSKELKYLVGFFYFSGWQEIYQSLQENPQVDLKILVGLEVDRHLSGIIETDNHDESLSHEEHFSRYMKSLGYALNNAEMDNEIFHHQVNFFIEMLENDRLKIRKTLNPNHAKLYLFQWDDHHKQVLNADGVFITGSSNLTKAGLHRQDEFNVEIRDYGFETAENYFDELWETAAPISEAPNGKTIIKDFLNNKTQAAFVTPYEAYAYILKTYIELQEHKKIKPGVSQLLENNGFESYSYQIDAVNQALNIINTYNGVIIADVVGLGKSVIASLIANQLGKRGLVICPPGLIGNKKDGSGWWEYLEKFKLWDWDIESSGNLEVIANSMTSHDFGYEVVIVDEAHKFRNQDTSAYEALADICRGKIVILLTATPFNNSPADIFSLLKLFIIPGFSGITIESDLEGRFYTYNYRFRNLSFIMKNYNSSDDAKRIKAENLYIKMFGLQPPININLVKKNVERMANDIKSLMSPVVIRRNRLDLKNDYQYSKEIQNLSEIKDPIELFYELGAEQAAFYDRIITDYFSEEGRFSGAIYKPFEYEKKSKTKRDEEENRAFQQQRNLFDFMRRLLVKRFESSFGAFEKSIGRFLRTHKMVKSFVEKSGKYILDRKAINAIYNEEDAESFALEDIENTLEEFLKNTKDKALPKHMRIYEVNKFDRKQAFLDDIDKDIRLFEIIQKEMEELNLVADDPKKRAILTKVKEILTSEVSPKRKVIIFSEYTDTIRHLKNDFNQAFHGRALSCDSGITRQFERTLNSNFNARYEEQKDDYDVLITSDKLSEGVNLNRAGVIINYDIPWNPTRVIQRLGRINRIGTKVFNELYIYNIFPTEKGASIVKSREIAEQKMFLIHNALGEDVKIFNPDEEPTASGLYKKLNSNPDEAEELSELTIIRNAFNEVKNKYPNVIERIHAFPSRTKTAKKFRENHIMVLRKKGLALFSLMAEKDAGQLKITQKTFLELLELVKCEYSEEKQALSEDFWPAYEKIKKYKPSHHIGRSDVTIEKKALNSLKFLLKQKGNIINRETVSFIDTLIRDIKKYKTLSTSALRRLVLPEKSDNKAVEVLLENIERMKERIGPDYLDMILKRISNIDDDIIIAVENRK